MTIHAGQPDGKPVCGMNAAPEQLLPIDLEGPINGKALGTVTCKSCLRIIAKRTGARPTPTAASAKGAPAARKKPGPKPKTTAAAAPAKAEPVESAAAKPAPAARKKPGPKPKTVAAEPPKAEPAAPKKRGRKPNPVTTAEPPKAEPAAPKKRGRKPKPVTTAEPPKAEPPTAAQMSDDAIRAIVREEISLGIEQLLRFGEVADVLAVSKAMVKQLVDAKELAVVMVAKKKARVTASSVESYIRRHTI